MLKTNLKFFQQEGRQPDFLDEGESSSSEMVPLQKNKPINTKNELNNSAKTELLQKLNLLRESAVALQQQSSVLNSKSDALYNDRLEMLRTSVSSVRQYDVNVLETKLNALPDDDLIIYHLIQALAFKENKDADNYARKTAVIGYQPLQLSKEEIDNTSLGQMQKQLTYTAEEAKLKMQEQFFLALGYARLQDVKILSSQIKKTSIAFFLGVLPGLLGCIFNPAIGTLTTCTSAVAAAEATYVMTLPTSAEEHRRLMAIDDSLYHHLWQSLAEAFEVTEEMVLGVAPEQSTTFSPAPGGPGSVN